MREKRRLSKFSPDLRGSCGSRMPTFDRRGTLFSNLIHVPQKLRPSVDVWGFVRRGNVTWACALGIRTNFLAHINANVREFVLDLDAVLQILCGTGLADGKRLDLLESWQSRPFLDLPMTGLLHLV